MLSTAASKKKSGGSANRSAYSVYFKISLCCKYKKNKWSSHNYFLGSLDGKTFDGHNVPPLSIFPKWMKSKEIIDALEIPVTPGKCDTRKKIWAPELAAVEEKLGEYLEVLENVLATEGIGTSFRLLQKKALEIAQIQMSEDDATKVKASSGWLQRALKRLGHNNMRLHGEGDTYTEEERKK
jgi:hypothetical protein